MPPPTSLPDIAAAAAAISKKDRPGEVMPLMKQKAAMAAAEGKNRRALEDIGNLVNLRITEGKPQTQILRHGTRRIDPLSNAQAAAANKKTMVDEKGCHRATKKVTFKPKAEETIKTSSANEDKHEQSVTTAASTASFGKSSRKKVHTLTSVLTARSKVACGLMGTQEEFVHDIDAADSGDQLAVVDYIEDIYKFYKLYELLFWPHDYMDSQVEINAKMRAILVDWLIEVHHKFELMPETLYLTIYIIDKYLSMATVIRRELQLLGVSAMLISSKYEEIWAPEVNDFISISNRAYTREQILFMEKEILNKLEWNLTVPTPYVFLMRFIKAAGCDKEMEHMIFFFAELGLMQYSMVIYCPSLFAASAVFAAHCTLKKSPLWSKSLKYYTGFSEDQLLDCTEILINSHTLAPESKLKVVYKKYSSEQFGTVALHPPAIKVVQDLKASSN